jgi:murein DD-endopeptidase / murein LD-carboxypeptidase
MDSADVSAARWPAIVAAARGCVGTRFRPQGRMPGLGLDCVGVLLVAAAAAGVVAGEVPVYRLGGDPPDLAVLLAGHGCWPVATALPGDVLVIAPAGRQRHFGIATDRGLVHAHAGLDRVVEGPIDPAWVTIGAWRLPGAR